MTCGTLAAPAIDPKKFRSVMGAFATGVAIVTSRLDEHYVGMAVNSLTAVSLDPCLLLFCANRGSSTASSIKARGAFAVNMLADDQHHLVKQFCGNPQDRFMGVSMVLSECGLPVISGSLAHLCCTVADLHTSGDHEIVIGRVHALGEGAGDPLVFFRGDYGCYQAMVRNDTAGRRVAV